MINPNNYKYSKINLKKIRLIIIILKQIACSSLLDIFYLNDDVLHKNQNKEGNN